LSTILLLCVLKKFWCQLHEDGNRIAPKHVQLMQKIICLIYRSTVLLAIIR